MAATKKKCSYCGACEEEGTRCSAEPLPEKRALVLTKWWHVALLVLLLVALGKALGAQPEDQRLTDLAAKLDKLAEACRK